MRRLLALDLSTNVGWAIMERGKPPVLGTLVLRGDFARKCETLAEFLSDKLSRTPCDAIAWERPILKPTDTIDVVRLLCGLVGVAASCVGERRWTEVTVQEVKFALTRSHKATKTEMLVGAHELGWRPVTDHEADAGAVGLVAYERIWPKARAA